MSVYMKPTSVIETRLEIEEGGYWHKRFASLCMKYMDQYVPKDSGELRRKTHIEDTTIVYPGPYAHYQYKGQREDGSHVIKQWSEPKTGPYWDRRMVSANMEDIEETLEKEMSGKGE